MDDKKSTIACEICSKEFQTRGGRSKHRRAVHPEATSSVSRCTSGKLVCGKCPSDAPTHPCQEALCHHLTEDHGIIANIFEQIFENEEEFQEWKTILEREGQVDYRARSTQPFSRTFLCFRTGFYDVKEDRLRAPKQTKTIKLGFNCTGFIRTKSDYDGRVYIKACTDHYGHGFDPKLQHLTEASKRRVVELIAEEEDPRTALKIVHDEAYSEGNETDPKMSMKDVRHIMERYKLYPERRSKSDAESVDILVNEITQTEQKSPFLLYKQYDPETAEFALGIQTELQKDYMRQYSANCICLHSTYNLTKYDLLLITVLTIDKYDHVFPVAFLLVNPEAEDIIQDFVNELKIQNCEIQTEYFMSDVPFLRQSWISVFGPDFTRVVCPWQIDKAWAKKCEELIEDSDERKKIEYNLKKMRKSESEDKFNTAYSNFFSLTEGYPEMRSYFQTYYFERISEWANFSLDSHVVCIATNLESFHSSYKETHFKKPASIRLDTLVDVLLTMVPHLDRKYNEVDVEETGEEEEQDETVSPQQNVLSLMEQMKYDVLTIDDDDKLNTIYERLEKVHGYITNHASKRISERYEYVEQLTPRVKYRKLD